MNVKSLVILLFCLAIGTAEAVVAWKGATVGNWNVFPNWAGGLPDANSTVILNHDRQTNAYTVVVQAAAETDKLWLQSFGDVPIHIRVAPGGTLSLNTLRMGDKEEDRASRFTIDGGSVIGYAATAAITNTSFLIGNNPGGTATLAITNSGSLSLLGENGITVASRTGSTGSVTIAGADLRIKGSMILGQGAGACGELVLSGDSSVSITGALHIAKLDNGTISPIGSVQVLGGRLECGTLNVGAAGNGLMTLNDGEVNVLGGGITLGKLNSTGRLIVTGGSLATTGSPMNIGHSDSSGTFVLTGGDAVIDGTITAGSSSRSFGRIDLSGGGIAARELIIGGAVSSTGEVAMAGGALDCGNVLQIGALGRGTLTLQGGLLETTNLMVGAEAYGECNLVDGELRVFGADASSLRISNGTVHIEQALLQWNNPNVAEAIANAVESGKLTWSNGLGAGTYSTNGYDGRLISEEAVLYWDNLDNGSQFAQSGIWVESPSFANWIEIFSLSPSNALWSADPDCDGLDNLAEYGLGGNPTNANDIGILPTFGIVDGGVEYVCRQRTDAAARGLGYYLELNINLVSGIWTNSGYAVVGTGEIGAGFEVVTNLVPTVPFATRFVRLRISAE